MILIGIDYSINSPAVCINKNNHEIYFYNLYKRTSKLTKKEQAGMKILEKFKSLQIEFRDKDDDVENYSDRETLRLVEFRQQIQTIMKFIDSILKDTAETIHVGIEGFSYGSRGNRLAELSGGQYLLRDRLYDKGYSIKIFSPKTIKATAGHGNWDKGQIIQAFLSDKLTEEMELRKEIENNKEILYINNKNWLKPLDDIIDSYWTMRTIENILG